MMQSKLLKLLHNIDAEKAHLITINSLRKTPDCVLDVFSQKKLYNTPISVGDINFPNPIGMAAGFDKNAEVIDKLLILGFGFVEVGSITPKPQAGNPKPRLFRYADDEAVINRMGFNNDGADVVLNRIIKFREKQSKSTNERIKKGIIGINIGANKDSENKINDYKIGIEKFYNVADYITINISSPNTQGLRNLQQEDSLKELLETVFTTKEKISSSLKKPIFLKIAPDLTESDISGIISQITQHPIGGLIISNTTISRPNNTADFYQQQGGLSGKPVYDISTNILNNIKSQLNNDIPIIGVGGITNYDTALDKFKSGANLLQAYSGFVFHGLSLLEQMLLAAQNQYKK